MAQAATMSGTGELGPMMLGHATSVLVVDDDQSICEIVAEALSLEGYAVVTAGNGAEALALVRANPPDSIVLDLMMPRLNGREFMEACRNENLCGRAPVLVMSADPGLAEAARELGAAACIAKPFDLDVLIEAMAHLVQGMAGPAKFTSAPSVVGPA
jgi:CheY-like chemotaxis protein